MTSNYQLYVEKMNIIIYAAMIAIVCLQIFIVVNAIITINSASEASDDGGTSNKDSSHFKNISSLNIVAAICGSISAIAIAVYVMWMAHAAHKAGKTANKQDTGAIMSDMANGLSISLDPNATDI